MIRINDNGDLERVSDGLRRLPEPEVIATAAELKAAFAERGMVVVPVEPLTAALDAAHSQVLAVCEHNERLNGGSTSPADRNDLEMIEKAQAALKEAP